MSTTAKAMSPVEQVCKMLGSDEMRSRFATALPSPDPKFADRFTRVVITAVQQNISLLDEKIDRQSLYNACVNAAKDGLLPDSREGALVPFKGKVQWMPMVAGIIKRLGESGIGINAQVVFTNDVFEQELGDDARIVHRAPPLGQDRGEPRGVYAIARDIKTGRVLDREVMDMDQIAQVRDVSRSKDDGPWVNWPGEMARKTVIRRLAKRLPITDSSVFDTIKRDDEFYELNPVPPIPALPAPAGDGPVVAVQAAPSKSGSKAGAKVIAAAAALPVAEPDF